MYYFKCTIEDAKISKVEQSIKILKILGLIENLKSLKFKNLKFKSMSQEFR